MLNKAVNECIEAKWQNDLKAKSSLKYINHISHIWLNQDLQIPSYEMIRNRIRDHFTQKRYATILVLFQSWNTIVSSEQILN